MIRGKKVLILAFAMSNFSYCSSLWTLPNSQSLSKIENLLMKGALRFLLNSYGSTAGRPKMILRR